MHLLLCWKLTNQFSQMPQVDKYLPKPKLAGTTSPEPHPVGFLKPERGWTIYTTYKSLLDNIRFIHYIVAFITLISLSFILGGFLCWTESCKLVSSDLFHARCGERTILDERGPTVFFGISQPWVTRIIRAISAAEVNYSSHTVFMTLFWMIKADKRARQKASDTEIPKLFCNCPPKPGKFCANEPRKIIEADVGFANHRPATTLNSVTRSTLE